MVYLALIADLINSRQLKNREEVQQLLESTLQSINSVYKEFIVSRFTITLGDEFQALLHTDAPIFFLIDKLESELYPYAVRFGIGYGSMSTKINPELSIGADGEAFWQARDALKHVHDNDDYGVAHTYFKGIGETKDGVINSVLALTDSLKHGWSDKQRHTFGKLLEADIYDDVFDQKQMAEEMGISQNAMYRRLKLSGIKLYMRSRKSLHNLICEVSAS